MIPYKAGWCRAFGSHFVIFQEEQLSFQVLLKAQCRTNEPQTQPEGQMISEKAGM